MLAVSEAKDGASWDSALLTLPTAHILQGWGWTDAKAQTGWQARRLLWTADGRPVAAAALLLRRMGAGLPLTVGYVPKGPLLDWSDAGLAESLLERLEAEARRGRLIFVKVDPDVQSDRPVGQAIQSLLVRRGWRPSEEQIQFRSTMITDLTLDEDALLSRMKPKWRYNIRLAERKGVTIRGGSKADLPVFYAMYVETGERDGFLVRPYSYYQSIWERFMADDLAHLLLAEVDGQPTAGLMLFRFGRTAWYFYGASTGHAREAMPNHALQWAALRWSKAAGCTRYDWWGAPARLDESDPMWGVYRFKAGFGGEFIPWIGAWDYVSNRSLYWLYSAVMPKLLDLGRRRHRISLPRSVPRPRAERDLSLARVPPWPVCHGT